VLCCTRLGANTGHKNSPKNRHLDSIAQLCRAIFSQLRHVSTIRKKNMLSSNISSTCPHNMVNFGPLAAEIGPVVWTLGHPCKFQRISLSHLGSVTARHSSSGRQPNFAELNRGRHLYSAGRPSRWAWPTFLVYSYNVGTFLSFLDLGIKIITLSLSVIAQKYIFFIVYL